MKRRQWLILAGSFLAATSSRAQGTGKAARVAIITGLNEQDPETRARLSAFREAMAKAGWRVGENLTIDLRYAPDTMEKARALVAELLALDPDVAVIQAPAMRAMLEANSRKPVVFVLGGDPVVAKWVDSLAHPGGNVTGLTSAEPTVATKWVEFLKEVVPELRHIAVVAHDNAAIYQPYIEEATRRLGSEARHVAAGALSDIESALAELATQPNAGLVLPTDAFTTSLRAEIVALTMKYRVPTISGSVPFGAAGALIVYAVDTVDIYRRSAAFVDQILRGVRPAEIPVQRPIAFRLIVNLRTARALGLTLPQTLLARADEVIE